MEAFNAHKFAELIVYLAKKCDGDRFFGATKMNKLLFFADFRAYKRFGRSITGAEYQALQHGPMPTQYLPTRRQLENASAIALQTWGPQNRIIALRKPNLNEFSREELDLINEVISRFDHYDSQMIVDESHELLGWQAAMAERESAGGKVTIPYGTALVSNRPINEGERARLNAVVAEHGWT